MKKIRACFVGMLLLLVCCLIPGETVFAATTARELFTFKIGDGATTQKVPVYEYTEDDGDVYVAAKSAQQTLTITAGKKNANFSITGKTAYFKKNYKSVIYVKKVSFSNTSIGKNLKFKVRTKNNVLRELKLTVLRPGINALTVSEKTFTPGSSKLKVQFNMRSATALKSYYKVTNSSGKVVYQKTLGTRKSTNYTTYWSGRPSKGNKAGLSATEYVPAGTYKLTGYVEYKVGSKTKYISKTVQIKIKKNDGPVMTDKPAGNITSDAVNWNWMMTLTGDDTVDYLAEKVCQEVLKNGMTELQRARELYIWCDKNLFHKVGQPSKYQPADYSARLNKVASSAEVAAYGIYLDALASGKMTIDSSDGYFVTKGTQKIKMDWLKSGFILKQGDCLINAAIYQTLLRHAGIEAHIVENTGSAGHHFWNVVKIGGKYYYTDVDRSTYDKVVSDGDFTYFLRGTSAFYKEKLYSTVAVNKKTNTGAYRYRIANSVSATDCPGR